MTITDKIFQHFCSTATAPVGYGMIDYVAGAVESAKGALLGLLGLRLYQKIGDLDLEALDETGGDMALQAMAYRYVCMLAMWNAIPQLDLTLSGTGFGVVSNQNLAPASRERVAALREAMRKGWEDALDGLLELLRGDARWCDTAMAKQYFSHLVWHAEQLRHMGVAEPHRTDLRQMQPLLSRAEMRVQQLIGPEQYFELCDAVRRRTETSAQLMAIGLCVGLIAALAAGSMADCELAKMALLRGLESDLDSFPAYRDSRAYEANHYRPYENRGDDPCYFFG